MKRTITGTAVLLCVSLLCSCNAGSSIDNTLEGQVGESSLESSQEESEIVIDIPVSTENSSGTAPTESAEETESATEPADSDSLAWDKIDGAELFKKDKLPYTDTGDIYLSGRILADAKLSDAFFSLDALYVNDDNKAVICYSLLGEQKKPFDGDIGEVTLSSQYLASYDLYERKIISQITLREDSADGSTSFWAGENSILVWTQDDEASKVKVYDYDLNEKGSFEKNSEDMGVLSSDGGSFYSIHSGKLIRINTEDGTKEQITFSEPFAPSYINSIYTDDTGKSYVFMEGKAQDIKDYKAVADIETGEIIYLKNTSGGSLYSEKDFLVERESWNADHVTYNLSYKNSGLYSYTFNTTADISLYILQDGIVLFSALDYGENESVMTLELWDVKNNTLLGETAMSFEPGEKWINFEPILFEDEKRLVLPLLDINMTASFYSWEYERKSSANKLNVTVTEMTPQIVKEQPVYICDPSIIIPGECQEEYKPLREYADQIEEQYGIDIYIGKECADIVGGYVVMPLNDYEATEQALTILSQELARYPEGFFKGFNTGSYPDGLDIYLTESLIGITDENLSQAGGIQTDYNGGYAIFADVSYPENLTGTFPHELSHAIDCVILSAVSDGKSIFDEDYWNSLNPVYDGYTYSYGQFGTTQLEPYIYSTENKENAYYIDSYSQTFPTEDRARLFEYACSDYGWVDWNASPHLKAKLDYYTQAIRLAFDSTGWENVIWEK